MRILLDECVPGKLRHQFGGLDVWTVSGMGWSGKKNGELIRLMTGEGFDVLITVDRNLRHQQNLGATGTSLVVLIAASNRLVDLVPLVPLALEILHSITPGEVVEITG